VPQFFCNPYSAGVYGEKVRKSGKEAVVKAADTVGLARMRDVSLNKDSAMLDEEQWFLRSIELDNQYAINMATSKVVDELIIKQIQLEDL